MKKFGIIGTSSITKLFVEGSELTENWKLCSVYSRSINKAEEFAKNYDGVKIYDDLEEFSKSGIEVVYIASPNSVHFGQAKYFLEREIPVICEKPICKQYSELEELIDISQKNEIYIFEALRHICTPNFFKIKDLVKEVGQVRQINLNFNQYSSRYNEFKKGNITNIFSLKYAGGALMDLGVYAISFCLAIFGEPQNTTYKAVKLHNGIDGCGSLIMEYQGFNAAISVSKITSASLQNEILGENGGICFNHITQQSEISFISLDGTLKKIEAENIPNNMVYEAQQFYDIMENNDKVRYEELKNISTSMMKILDRSREQNGIVWEE